jgi:Replication factor C C-terminal domain
MCDPFIFPVISKLKTERGLALQDLITGAYDYVGTVDFPPQSRVYLLDYLATTEWVDFISNGSIVAHRVSSDTGYLLVAMKRFS